MPYSRSEALHATRRKFIGRRILVTLRDTWLLLREFQIILILFLVTMLGAATSFMLLWNNVPGDLDPEHLRWIDSLYFTMTMLFLEPTLDFPEQPILDAYFFLVPLLGLVFLTLGVADFAILLFNRHARRDEWEASVASTMNNHIIVVGLGHVGIRVVRELVVLDQDVVVIQRDDHEDHFEEARGYEVPVIRGDARRPETLEKAGLMKAMSIIMCTGDDLANLQVVSAVRELRREGIRVVVRMFDDHFARNLAEGLGIDAVISSSAMAAPAFAGAATGTEIVQTFTLENKSLAMSRIVIKHGSKLDGMDVRTLEHNLDLSVVLLHKEGQDVDIEPRGDVVLVADDVIAVVAEIPALRQLSRVWNTDGTAPDSGSLVSKLFGRPS
jgi:Trk K+ transport system NAD-binding subunit